VPPQTPPINPYGAPQAPVGDVVAGEHAILEQARSVSADHGLAWYREAWRLFKLSPGIWIGMWIVFVAILAVISIIPLIGSLVIAVITPIFVGGVMIAARNADHNNAVRFGDLFAAFSGGRAGALALIGVIQLALSIAFFLVFALVVGFGGAFAMFAGNMTPDQMGAGAIGTMVMLGLLSVVIFVPITNAVWLASALSALEGAGAMDALRRAFSATFRNILALVVLALITLVLAIAATIPFGLGWLVLGPVIMCVMYAQFEDLFDAAAAQT
jgi:uncharacterized membrane protein